MKVILPGSYDPITLGHLEIIKWAAREYGEVFVVAFVNPEKEYTFSPKEKLDMLKLATEGMDGVTVDFSSGLVVDYMREKGIELIVKGYRTDADLPWEIKQAEWNEAHGGYKTRLIKCAEGFENISSTAAREAMASGDREALSALLPTRVAEYIEALGKIKNS